MPIGNFSKIIYFKNEGNLGDRVAARGMAIYYQQRYQDDIEIQELDEGEVDPAIPAGSLLIAVGDHGARMLMRLQELGNLPDGVETILTAHQTTEDYHKAVTQGVVSYPFVSVSGITDFERGIFRDAERRVYETIGVPVDMQERVRHREAFMDLSSEDNPLLPVNRGEGARRMVVLFGGDAPESSCSLGEDGELYQLLKITNCI